ncbi:conserved hypothetical protein [Neospora caninum Liverpool]|uniref:Uncharacterized protein n=1 Tax=Neospora caninum (strain Liverpool) TaxID=572307 RepID=F0VKA0_NEOCL|nr:conserved hypothetical protein [Neospora caninum Liverpool]CBZ54501.1 conserved hypothetical protein [Neospora caninum Liverpool]|eukprot:XP_003884531.1 conserved hypothetical protein [Neospora caninum Liverpool]
MKPLRCGKSVRRIQLTSLFIIDPIQVSQVAKMVDWQLLAIIGFSVTGVLLLVLVVVTVAFLRRRRCTHKHYHAEVLELKENLKAAQVEKEAKEDEFTSLRRSVADFDAERSLLLKRLESCGSNPTPEEIRCCLRELQLYLAIQAANSLCLRKAVNADYKQGPPALLAEVWLVHGELYTTRDDDSYPCLGGYGAMIVYCAKRT